MVVTITRTEEDEHQTLGELYLSKGDFTCKTLELPWNNNKRRVSCIPVGCYVVKKRVSEKYGDHFHVQNVENRDYILIHHGNYKKDVLGCILVGKSHRDIDGDGYKDVVESKKTMTKLNEVLPDKFILEVM